MADQYLVSAARRLKEQLAGSQMSPAERKARESWKLIMDEFNTNREAKAAEEAKAQEAIDASHQSRLAEDASIRDMVNQALIDEVFGSGALTDEEKARRAMKTYEYESNKDDIAALDKLSELRRIVEAGAVQNPQTVLEPQIPEESAEEIEAEPNYSQAIKDEFAKLYAQQEDQAKFQQFLEDSHNARLADDARIRADLAAQQQAEEDANRQFLEDSHAARLADDKANRQAYKEKKSNSEKSNNGGKQSSGSKGSLKDLAKGQFGKK